MVSADWDWHLRGKVLITGGAGFLARGIYRRAQRESWPAEFTALSRDDAKHAKLQADYPFVRTVLGDVVTMDPERMTDLMRGFDIVIHAAASKYVDRAELSPVDTFQTNVVGSMNVAVAAARAQVPYAIAISTDKACQPVNTYGASKLLMERIWQGMPVGPTNFTAVRYGNVVGSTGSVLTLFERQLATDGHISLTDERMSRFWMSVDEAIDTILWALHVMPGEIVIPKMRASTMRDVACAALGFDERKPLPEDRVRIIGLRPGEKMHEQIIHRQESVRVSGGDQFRKPWFMRPPVPTEIDDARPELIGVPFEVTSADPPLGTIPITELREMVDDAARV
jgi:UDP-N-acetylglucosamine 4,6-dehydratase